MTYRNLSVELRPQRLSELVGQDVLVQRLRNQYADGQVPIGMLLTGAFGTGKTTIARILALSFLCDHKTEFGEPCEDCIENETLFHIIERNCAELTTLESVKDLTPTLNVYPNFGKYRIIILDEAQQMSDKAQQALLKYAEENSINIFIFCTSDPTKINQAVKDRCAPFAIPELTTAGVTALVNSTMALAYARFGTPGREAQPLIEAINSANMTSARNIVTATDMYLKGASAHQAIVIKEAGDINYYRLFDLIGWGKWNEAREILLLAKPADGKELKSRISAHFRALLLKRPASPRAALLSRFIKELAANESDDVGMLLSAVVGTIYRICEMVNEAAAKKKAA